MEVSGDSPVLRRDVEAQVDEQLRSADAHCQVTDTSRAAERDTAPSPASAFNAQFSETNPQTVSMGTTEHRSAATPESPTAGRGRTQSLPRAAPSLEVDGYHEPAPAMATSASRAHAQAEATETLRGPQTPGQSAGDAVKRPSPVQRRRIGEMLCSAFKESIEGEVEIEAKPPPRAGRPPALMARRTSLQALVAKKWPSPGSAPRRESTTSTGSGSGVNFSKRSIRRGGTDEAERAVKAIVKRVSRRREATEKGRGSQGGESGDDGIDSNGSDDDVHETDTKADDADSDCDVSCDRVFDTARERLAHRKKDVDSALAWLKHELHQIRAQDEQLMQQFHKLRHGIFLLRQQSSSRHFHRTLSRRKRNPKNSTPSTATIGSALPEQPQGAAWDAPDFGCVGSERRASTGREPTGSGRPMAKSFLESMFRTRSNSVTSNSSMWHIEEVTSLPSSPVCQRVRLTSILSGSSPCIENLGDSSDEDDEPPLAGHLPRVPSVRVKRPRRMSSAQSSGSEGELAVRQRSRSISDQSAGSRRQSQAPAPMQPSVTYKALKRQAALRYEKRQSRKVESTPGDQSLTTSASDGQLKLSEMEVPAPTTDSEVSGRERDLNLKLSSPTSPSVLENRVLDSPIMQTSPRVVRVCHGEVVRRTPVRIRKRQKPEHKPSPPVGTDNVDGDEAKRAGEEPSQSNERQHGNGNNVFQFADPTPPTSDAGVPLTRNQPLEADTVEPRHGVDMQCGGLPQLGHQAEQHTDASSADAPAPANPAIFYPTVVGAPPQVVPREKYGTLPRSFRGSKRHSVSEKADSYPAHRISRDDSDLPLGAEIYNMIHSSSISSGQMLNRRYSQLSDDIDFYGVDSPPATPSKRASFTLRRRSSRPKNMEATVEDVVPELTAENGNKAVQALRLGEHHRRESMQFFDRDTLNRGEGKPAAAATAAEKKSGAVARWRKEDGGKFQRAFSKRVLRPTACDLPLAGSPSTTSPVLLSYSPSLDAARLPMIAAPVWAEEMQTDERPPSQTPPDDQQRSGNTLLSPEDDGRHAQAPLRKTSSPSMVALGTGLQENQDSFRTRKRRITVSAGVIPTSPDRRPAANKPVPPPSRPEEPAGEEGVKRSRSTHVSSKSTPGLRHAMDKLRRSLPGGMRRRSSTADKPVKLRRGKAGKVDTEYEVVRTSPGGTPVEGRSANPTPLGSTADLCGSGGSGGAWLTASHSSLSSRDGLQQPPPLTSAQFLGNAMFDGGRPRSFTTNDFYLSRSLANMHDEGQYDSHDDALSQHSGDGRPPSVGNSLADLREDPNEQVQAAAPAAAARQRTHL